MMINQIDRIRTYVSASYGKNLTIDHDNHIITYHSPIKHAEKIYVPEPTGKIFHSDRSQVRLLKGAYGSGKTSICINEIIFLAAQMPACKDGIRKCKVGVIRNTYGELETTTIKSWDDWTSGHLEQVSRSMKPPITMTYRFSDDHGMVEIDLIFLSLNRSEDFGKIKSLEVTFCFVNEACEVPFSLLTHLLGRTGRYPSLKMLPDGATYWSGLIMDTNPPSTRHPIYKTFEQDKPQGYKIFNQPPALIKLEDGSYIINPLAENIKHLPKKEKYYLDMVHGSTEEYIKVYAMGQYGIVIGGLSVYPNYNDDIHSVETIKVESGAEVIIGWDFGTLTNAAVIAQIVSGQIRLIKEFTIERESIENFAKKIVIPYLNQNFIGCTITSIADPSGAAENYTNMLSGIRILNNLGINTIKASTNKIKPRIDSVTFFLSSIGGGYPSFSLSRSGCPILREGLLGMYKYRKIQTVGDGGEIKYVEEPDKSHPYSDVQDCLQYICLHYNSKISTAKSEAFDPRQWAR